MRIFVTGASGWIGSAVAAELINSGHDVIGLARSESSASALSAAGVHVLRGSLEDLDAIRLGAADSDGVIHLAFNHELAFSGNFKAAADADRRVMEAFADALAGSDRPLVIASGTLGLSVAGRPATELDGHGAEAPPAAHGEGPRARWESTEYTLSLASSGVRSVVVRLPPTNHGVGDTGFIPALINIARAAGVAGYLGDGSNRWPAVHRLDSAHLFCLALENAPAGTTLHAVADEGVPLREIADVMGRHLDVPVESISAEKAVEHFTWLAGFVGVDSPASSAITRELMSWQPTQPSLIEDLDEGHYFKVPTA
jgi:nucleoside-diphosphate-sugar epimerase